MWHSVSVYTNFIHVYTYIIYVYAIVARKLRCICIRTKAGPRMRVSNSTWTKLTIKLCLYSTTLKTVVSTDARKKWYNYCNHTSSSNNWCSHTKYNGLSVKELERDGWRHGKNNMRTLDHPEQLLNSYFGDRCKHYYYNWGRHWYIHRLHATGWRVTSAG